MGSVLGRYRWLESMQLYVLPLECVTSGYVEPCMCVMIIWLELQGYFRGRITQSHGTG